MSKFVDIETRSGEPIQAGGRTLTPFSQVLQIRIPGLSGGLIWNRPVSVLAVSDDGQEQVIPVPDLTRQVQWGLLGSSLAGSLLLWFIFRRIRRS